VFNMDENEENTEEIINIKDCIVKMSKEGDLNINCESPTTTIKISSEELSLLDGINNIIKKEKEK